MSYLLAALLILALSDAGAFAAVMHWLIGWRR